MDEERDILHNGVFLIARHIALHRFPAMKPSDIRLQNGRHDMYDSILLLVHSMSEVMKTLSPPPVPPTWGGLGRGKKKGAKRSGSPLPHSLEGTKKKMWPKSSKYARPSCRSLGLPPSGPRVRVWGINALKALRRVRRTLGFTPRAD